MDLLQETSSIWNKILRKPCPWVDLLSFWPRHPWNLEPFNLAPFVPWHPWHLLSPDTLDTFCFCSLMTPLVQYIMVHHFLDYSRTYSIEHSRIFYELSSLDSVFWDLSFRTQMNFKSLGHQELCQKHPYQPSPGWILGEKDAFNTHSVVRVSPGGFMFWKSSL